MEKKRSKRGKAQNKKRRSKRGGEEKRKDYAVDFMELDTQEEQNSEPEDCPESEPGEAYPESEEAAGVEESESEPEEAYPESEEAAGAEESESEPEEAYPESEEAAGAEESESEPEEAYPESEEAAESEENAAEWEDFAEEADTRANGGISMETAMEEYVITEIPETSFDKRKLWKGALAVLGLCSVAYLLLVLGCVKPEVTVEVGEGCPEIDEFVNWPGSNAHFVAGTDRKKAYTELGDYGVMISAYGKRHASVIHVRDTVAPELETVDVTCYNGNKVSPEDFVAEIKDATKTSVRFAESPDFMKKGKQEVLLLAQDAGGNVTETKAFLTVVYDTKPPVIDGVEEITITAGESVSYRKGVSATDNLDDSVELVIDTSEVDTNQAGDYTVTYTAVDSAGNETTVETTLHVKQPTIETVTVEIVNAEADRILATILTEDMSQYEMAKAIYWWCHENIAYSDGTPKISPEAGAFQGLAYRRGDCYTYAMTAKFLLTQAGIKNMDIERIPDGNRMHYWNLIDIGEGWYHFDTCRRADGFTFFYKTDAEIKRYSDANHGTHNYDRSLYPKIQ